MTDTVATNVSTRSPIDAIHQRLGAAMVDQDGSLVPDSYGDLLFEYAAVREGGAGIIDLSSRGRILVSGTEAVQFLNGLITNDMKTLAEHVWMPAAFPNVQGRMIASVRVIRLKDDQTEKNVCPTFLIDTEAAAHERVLKTIERFTLAGDFHVNDVTAKTAMLSLQGRNAPKVAREVLGEGVAEIPLNQVIQAGWPAASENADEAGDLSRGVTLIRASHTAEDGFDCVLNADQADKLWEALQTAGARPVGYQALEMLRIEAGLPRHGVDMDETNVVTEVLDDAVSYTKGCYVGQEIIARIKYRGHVAKKLSGVMFEQAAKVEAGAAIKSKEGKEIGHVTSVTYSPHLGRTIALAYLKYDYIAPGNRVEVAGAEGTYEAQVIALPFVNDVSQVNV
jgi:folate-binding protein YgfZ